MKAVKAGNRYLFKILLFKKKSCIHFVIRCRSRMARFFTAFQSLGVPQASGTVIVSMVGSPRSF